jgi:hypothetical protein
VAEDGDDVGTRRRAGSVRMWLKRDAEDHLSAGKIPPPRVYPECTLLRKLIDLPSDRTFPRAYEPCRPKTFRPFLRLLPEAKPLYILILAML